LLQNYFLRRKVIYYDLTMFLMMTVRRMSQGMENV